MEPTPRKLIGAAAFSLALAGGGIAGALLGTPGTSGAQEETSTTATDDAATATPTPPADGEGRPHGGPGGRGFGGPGGARLDTAAEAIGISADELKAELEGGKSIAQVAEEHGVEAQTVVDALVAEGLDRLAEIEAELPERVTEAVNREGLPERGGRPGPRGDGEQPASDA